MNFAKKILSLFFFGILFLPIFPIPGESTPLTFSCSKGDTEEGTCCCFLGEHTYLFPPIYVQSAEIRFDTGRGYGCKSKVFIEVLSEGLWGIRHTLEAVSSGASEKHRIQVDLPMNSTIEGIRLRDDCVCCIDFSEITLHTQGEKPQEILPDLPYPTAWEINGNGERGILQLKKNQGKYHVYGTLLGAAVSGELTDRHLVLHCTRKGARERWEGWILHRGEAPKDATFFIAGTFSKSGSPELYPWYALPRGSSPVNTPETPFGSPSKNPHALMGTIYALPEGSTRLPNFSALTPMGRLYTESLNVSPRSFTQGFPGITHRFEWFGIIYEGRFLVERGGNHTLRLHSDDGSRLWIDGKLLIDNDGIHPPQSKSASVLLTPGEHTLWVEYFQGPRDMIALSLHVIYPGETKEKIFSPRWLPLF